MRSEQEEQARALIDSYPVHDREWHNAVDHLLKSPLMSAAILTLVWDVPRAAISPMQKLQMVLRVTEDQARGLIAKLGKELAN